MKNWKTTLFGLATLGVYIGCYIFPEHKEFLNGLIPLLVTGGFLSAKDNNVTGGTREQ